MNGVAIREWTIECEMCNGKVLMRQIDSVGSPFGQCDECKQLYYAIFRFDGSGIQYNSVPEHLAHFWTNPPSPIELGAAVVPDLNELNKEAT